MSWLKRTLKRLTFNNKKFWNQRYIEDPEKGSGPGSRGEHLLLKENLIRSILSQHHPQSILDIGCGDIAPFAALDIPSYTGIDIADVIVDRNKKLKPNWTFLCEDLTGPYTPPAADFVLCLDVLIHQKTRHAYNTLLSKSLGATKKIALISGYSQIDPAWNVFFHEPLADSIRKLCPTAKIQKLAEYRRTDLFQVEK